MMSRKSNSVVAPAILIDARETARRLAISPRTLWQLTKDRVVPSIRIGKCVRYRVADLDEWTRQQVQREREPWQASATNRAGGQFSSSV
jgi:excisionase family DNA binding protein